MEAIGGIGMVLSAIPKTQQDGMIIVLHTESLSDRLVSCAKENEQFYRTLSTVLAGSVWTALAVECGTIVGSIFAVHGFNPLAKLGKPAKNDDSANTSI